MGLPMVMTSPNGEATNILEKSNSGVIVNPESPKDVALIIRELYNDHPRLKVIAVNSSQAAKNYDRKQLAELMLSKIEELV